MGSFFPLVNPFHSFLKVLVRASGVLGSPGLSGQRHVVWPRGPDPSRPLILWYSSQTALVFPRHAPSHPRRKPRRQCVLVRQCSVYGANGVIGRQLVGRPHEPGKYSQWYYVFSFISLVWSILQTKSTVSECDIYAWSVAICACLPCTSLRNSRICHVHAVVRIVQWGENNDTRLAYLCAEVGGRIPTFYFMCKKLKILRFYNEKRWKRWNFSGVFNSYSPMFTVPEANNCFSIILRCGNQKVKKKTKTWQATHKKVTSLSSCALKCYIYRVAGWI